MRSLSQSIDVEEFQQQVATIAGQIDAVRAGIDPAFSRRLGAVSGDDKALIVDEVVNQVYQDAATKAALGSKEELRQAALEVRSALRNPSIRAALCRSLGPVTSKSSREFAVELTKASLPLVLTGQLAVPASPLVWGLLGVSVAWVGLTWLCSDVGCPGA
jgi:hypothetical protein